MTKNESLRYERYGSLGKVFFFTALFIGLFSLYEGAKPEGTPWLWGGSIACFLSGFLAVLLFWRAAGANDHRTFFDIWNK